MLINIIGSCLKLIKNKMYVIKFLNITCKKNITSLSIFDLDYIWKHSHIVIIIKKLIITKIDNKHTHIPTSKITNQSIT